MNKKFKKKMRFYLRFLNYPGNVLSKEIEKNLDFKGKNVIDLGCDDGFYELKLKNKCSKIVAIDINKFVIEINKNLIKDKNICFKVDNIEHLNVQKYGKFDYVLFMNMIFLIKFDSAFIKRMLNLLKNRGIVIMQVPNKFSTHYQEFKNEKKGKRGIVNEPSIGDIIEKMDSKGFTLIFKKGLFYSPYWGIPFYFSYLHLIRQWIKKEKLPSSYLLIFEKK